MAFRGWMVAGMLAAMAVPAMAQDWGRPEGYDRREVAISAVTYPGGRFVYEGRGRWTEYASSGAVKARFDELSRSPDWIDLNDPSRDLQIRLNLRQRAILVTEHGGAYRPLYSVSSIENDRRGRPGGFGFGFGDRGDRGGYDGGYRDQPQVFEVEAGSWLVNQFDAQRICPGVAQRNNGTWTGNYRTTKPTVMSVCEVRRTR